MSSGVENAEMYYYSALICLKSKRYEEGLDYLRKIIKKHPMFKKNAFLFAAISCKNLSMKKPNLTLNSQSQLNKNSLNRELNTKSQASNYSVKFNNQEQDDSEDEDYYGYDFGDKK